MRLPTACLLWWKQGSRDVNRGLVVAKEDEKLQEAALKRRLQRLLVDHPVLQQQLRTGDRVSPELPQVLLLGSRLSDHESRQFHIGIAYSSLVSGCSCADDPTPVSAQPEYCELLVEIGVDGEVQGIKPLEDE